MGYFFVNLDQETVTQKTDQLDRETIHDLLNTYDVVFHSTHHDNIVVVVPRLIPAIHTNTAFRIAGFNHVILSNAIVSHSFQHQHKTFFKNKTEELENIKELISFVDLTESPP